MKEPSSPSDAAADAAATVHLPPQGRPPGPVRLARTKLCVTMLDKNIKQIIPQNMFDKKGPLTQYKDQHRAFLCPQELSHVPTIGEAQESSLGEQGLYTVHAFMDGMSGFCVDNSPPNSSVPMARWVHDYFKVLHEKYKDTDVPLCGVNYFIASLWSIGIHRNEVRFGNAKPSWRRLFHLLNGFVEDAMERSREICKLRASVLRLSRRLRDQDDHVGGGGSATSFPDVRIVVDGAWDSISLAAGWAWVGSCSVLGSARGGGAQNGYTYSAAQSEVMGVLDAPL